MLYVIFMMLIMMIGLMIGITTRVEHNMIPINNYLLFAWVAVSIWGLYSTPITELFLFMNMVTVGWILYPLMP